MTGKARIATFALLAIAVVGVVGFGLAGGEAVAAESKRCAPVVRGFDFGGSPSFYRAKVLIVRGAKQVPCSEARKVAWRLMDPPDFCEGNLTGCNIRGWRCVSQGYPAHGKCVKEDPRRVIKLLRPRYCPQCRGNRN